MQKSERSVYHSSDFLQWEATGGLSLTPKFQRRGVWKAAARSFFIDSLLKGMPVPPIYIRQIQSAEYKRVIREVIDGQQRVSAILDFVNGEYRLSRTLGGPWAGKTFEQLSDEEKNQILSYSFSVELLQGISDFEVLEVFSRLNTYSVPLNKQELRNGRYFGLFKQTAYRLAYNHLEFWRRHGVFSEQQIARMSEVEFVSEIMIAFLAGMQDKKKSIDSFYSDFDGAFAEQQEIEKRFRDAVDDVNLTFPDTLKQSPFRRVPLLYTVFCVVEHHRHGLPGAKPETAHRPLNNNQRLSLRDALNALSDSMELSGDGEPYPRSHAGFVNASLQQTDNIRPRTERFENLYKLAFL